MKSFEPCEGLGPLTSSWVTLEEIKGIPRARTGYEFRLVRLEGSNEMPVYVFRQLKKPG